MDTSLKVISSAASLGRPTERTAAPLDPANNGKFAPVSGKALPPTAVPTAGTAAKPEKESGESLSLIAKALVAEFDPSGRIERTEQAVAKLNEILKDRERDLEFSVDESTGRTILKVIHAESGEVIRQIPPEELLQIARTFIEGTGSLIQDEA